MTENIGDQLNVEIERMRRSEVLPLHRETIRQLVLEAGKANPRVCGSVVRGEDNEVSDLDFLVDPRPGTSLMTIVRVQDELAAATGSRWICKPLEICTPLSGSSAG